MHGNKRPFQFTGDRGGGRKDFFQHDVRSSSTSNSSRGGGGRGYQKHNNIYNYNRGRGRGNFRGGPPKTFYDRDSNMRDLKSSRHKQGFENSQRGHRRFVSDHSRNYVNNRAAWHKIIIRNGALYSKEEILLAIRAQIDEEFIPFVMEVEGPSMVFYLEKNPQVARAILNLSNRITIGNDSKRAVISCTENAPPLRKVLPPQVEVVKKVMGERYGIELKRLDLKNFHHDKTLIRDEIFCPLYRTLNIEIVIDIIIDNCPLVEEIDLSNNQISIGSDWQKLSQCPNLKILNLNKNKIKSVECLERLRILKINELSLEGNPLCEKYSDSESYISAVRKYFPKITKLDGIELQKAISFEVDDNVNVPAILPSFFCNDEVKAVALSFVQQYYQVFESEDRSPLEAAYTLDAFFSLSCNIPHDSTSNASRFNKPFLNLNRNFKHMHSTDKRISSIVRGRPEIVKTLQSLPSMAHIPDSFVLDVPFAQPGLMHVVLTGLFKQTHSKSTVYRSFMKSMIVVPTGGGFCISNDQLYINTASVDQIKKAVQSENSSSASTSASEENFDANNYTAGLSSEQLEMMKLFATNSKMLPQYCRMCLERNNWDFTKAGEMFMNLQKENKIPPEYYGKS